MIWLTDVLDALRGAIWIRRQRLASEKYFLAHPECRPHWQDVAGKLTYKNDIKCFKRIIRVARLKRRLFKQAVDLLS